MMVAEGPWNSVVAVVLAGGRDDELSRREGVAVKALAPIGDKPMAAFVLEALRGCPQVKRCIYVGQRTPLLDALSWVQCDPADTFAKSLRIGLDVACKETSADQRILALGADIPWLTAQAVDDLLRRAPDASLVYPVVSREAAEVQFPTQKRTYAKLNDGVFTGGNVLLLTPRVVPKLLPLLERAYRVRKSPLALARIVGPGIMIRFLIKNLSLAALERRASQLLGAPARVLVSEHAAIGADVDSVEHLQQARRALAGSV